MKYLLLSSLFLINILLFSQNNENIYDIIIEADPNIKRLKLEWIEESHKTEPNVNWRIIEAANQSAQFDRMNLMTKEYTKNPYLQASDVIANGTVIGKWIEKGSNNLAGRIHTADIDFDNDMIYAASAGGNVFSGKIDGSEWKCLNNSTKFPNIKSIKAIKINNIKRIIVVANSPAMLYYSDNEGTSWNKAKGLDGPAAWGELKRGVFVANSNNTIFIIGNEWDWKVSKSIASIYYSIDQGMNFTLAYKFANDKNQADLWTNPNEESLVYFVNQDTLSTFSNTAKRQIIEVFNYGVAASKIKSLLLQGAKYDNQISLRASIMFSTSNNSFFFKKDGAGTLVSSGQLNQGPFDINSFAISALNPNHFFHGAVELKKSFSSGAIWEIQNTWNEYYQDMNSKLHADIPGILSFIKKDGSEIFLIGTDGGLSITEDEFATVKNIGLMGLNVSQYYSTYSFQNKTGILYAGSQDQGYQTNLKDDGSSFSFKQVLSGDYGHLNSSDLGKNIWSVYPSFAMISTNNTSSNPTLARWYLIGTNTQWMPQIVADPYNGQSAYYAGGIPPNQSNAGPRLWKLTYNEPNISYTILSKNFNENSGSSITALATSDLEPDNIYVMNNSGVFYKSIDKGANWITTNNFKGPESHYFYGNTILASKSNPNIIYVSGNGYSSASVWKSINGGNSFARMDSGLPKTMVYQIAATDDDNFIFAATESGPYIYSKLIGKWFDMSTPNSPNQVYWSVEFLQQENIARFGTYGRGIWDFKIESKNDIIDGDTQDISIPEIRVFPNPSSSTVNFDFNNQILSHGNIKIYDLSGKCVRNLYNGEFGIGLNKFKWDFKTDSDIILPNAPYLGILTINNKVQYFKIQKGG